jgi:streptogrisin C
MERDLHLSASQARTRIQTDLAAATTDHQLKAELGKTYAGSWINHDGRLVVGTTSTSATTTDLVQKQGATSKIVARSLTQLNSDKATLDRSKKQATDAVQSWYVDPASNSIVITATTTKAATDFADRAGLNPAWVKTVINNQPTREASDIRGGDGFWSAEGCSIGFPVVNGFLTAAHCTHLGDGVRGWDGTTPVGTVVGWQHTGNDYAFVAVNRGFTPQPWVNNNGSNVNITGSQAAVTGASVCRTGVTTGWHCGVITAVNVTLNFANDPWYGLIQTNACAELGDSGGPLVAGSQAQGTLSWITGGDCTTGGETSLFEPVNTALSLFGLTLKTTSTSGTASRIKGYQSRCIDAGSAVNGQPLTMQTCSELPAQNWTFLSDGTVRALGKCMDVSGASTGNGAAVQLYTCHDGVGQKFVLQSNGELVNPHSGRCVDIPAESTAAGVKLQQWDCHLGVGQKWQRD